VVTAAVDTDAVMEKEEESGGALGSEGASAEPPGGM
jgi:hypothetical protein